MTARPLSSRRRTRLARRWPTLLLVPLAALALVGPLGPFPLSLPFLGTIGVPVAALVGLWALGAAAVAAAPLLRPREERSVTRAEEARWLLLALLAIRLNIAIAGVEPPAWWIAYAIVFVIAAARIPGWWPPVLCFLTVTLLEAGPVLLFPSRAGRAAAVAEEWRTLPGLGLLGLLAAVAGGLFASARRERAALQAAVELHHRDRAEAEELSALGDYRAPEAASLTPESKSKRILGAVAGLGANLDRMLGLAGLALGARSVFLFLLDEDGERLVLRCLAEAEGTVVDRGVAIRLGEGLIGHAAKTRRPALFTNLETDSLRPALYADDTLVPSLMVAPVNEHGVLRGVLVVDAGEPGVFGRGHEQLLERFAGEVGALLENARDDARQERTSVRFETLLYFSQKFSASIKLGEILAQMVDDIHQIVPYQRCALYLADAPRRRLVLRAQRGFLERDEDEREVSLRWDQDIPGYIASHARPLLFSNLRERRRGVEVVPGSPGQERIRSILGVPLRQGEDLIGVLILTGEDPGRFVAEDLELLTVVANQAAILIANALLHQQVERTAVTDGLTGLFNHRHFQERLEQELDRVNRTRERVSLLLLDIDHFKKINDTYGHPFGDQVIKALSAALGALARRVDVVARYGGEEFAMILVNTDRRGCRTMAQRVLKAVRAISIPQEGKAFSFTVSVGAATCPDDAANREDLVRSADRALYAAKAGGRNQAKAADELGKS